MYNINVHYKRVSLVSNNFRTSIDIFSEMCNPQSKTAPSYLLKKSEKDSYLFLALTQHFKRPISDNRDWKDLFNFENMSEVIDKTFELIGAAKEGTKIREDLIKELYGFLNGDRPNEEPRPYFYLFFYHRKKHESHLKLILSKLQELPEYKAKTLPQLTEDVITNIVRSAEREPILEAFSEYLTPPE